MASFSNKTIAMSMFMCIALFLMFVDGESTEFLVGESKGWGVPPPKDPNTFNQWAEKKRFKVNDTLEFQYKKDSVMEVIEAEYEKCRSSAPIFFANKGDTTVQLNRSGLFYFISGVTGHCERGQKMIVKVLDVETPADPQGPPVEGGDSGDKKKNGATQVKFMGVSTMLFLVLGFGLVMG